MLPNLPVLEPIKIEIPAIIRPAEEKKDPPKPLPYIIKSGDTLTSIAKAHNTTVERLWEKNTDLTNPDLIEPEKQLKIPEPNEELGDRPFPAQTSIVEPVRGSQGQRQTIQPRASSYNGYTAGNTYYAGQCVWYVKNQLGWVENGWGNASEWKYTSGHYVSAAPAVGTVAWARSYGHVAIVTSVNGDGTVGIREMNYQGPYIVSSRTAPVSEFEYIYP